MEISPSAKVGMVVVVSTIMLLGIMAFLGIGKKQDPGVPYYIVFKNVSGLTVGSNVLKAGVIVGKVINIEIIGESEPVELRNKVRVTITLKSSKETLTKESNYMISTNLMGDKWLEIHPAGITKLSACNLNSKKPWGCDYAIGTPPVSMDDLMYEAKVAVDDLQQAVENFNTIIGSEALQQDLIASVANFKEISTDLKGMSSRLNTGLDGMIARANGIMDQASVVIANVNTQITVAGGDVQAFTGTLKRVALKNETSVNSIVSNLEDTSANLKSAMDSMQKVVADGRFGESILTTLEQIAATSEEIHGIASDIRSLTSDPQVKDDLKQTIHETKETMEGANKLINRIRGVVGDADGKGGNKNRLVQLDTDMVWDTKTGHSAGNANLFLLPRGSNMIKVGVEDIGIDNHLNLQYGKNYGSLRPRVGVVRSDIGVGTDAFIGNNFELSVDAYDPSKVKVDILGKIVINDSFYITGGVRDAFNGNQGILGVGKRF